GCAAVRAAFLQRCGEAVPDAHRIVPGQRHGQALSLPADAILRDDRARAGEGDPLRRWILLLALVSVRALAVERVTDFHSTIEIAADGELTVHERISVEVEGREIRRGIVRDFPTDYRDRFGNRVSVPFDVVGVKRDGRPETYALERLPNGERIRIGRGDVLLAPGTHTYELTYRTAHQVGHFPDHDELYWNVN